MAITASRGARLAYVVVKLDMKVERPVTVWSKDQGLQTKMQKEDGGYLVYFPRGHVIRVRDLTHLAHYRLDKDPPVINMQGLSDPNTPLGKMMLSQDDDARAKAWADMEQQVIALATAKSGPIVMPEQVRPHRAEDVGVG